METSDAITAFETALETGDLDAIRRVPKSDLHNHFFLGGNRALVSEWAGRDIAPLDHKLSCMAEMHEWVQTRFGTLFAGAQGRLKAFEATLVQAKLDGITRLEKCETPWAIDLHNGAATALTDACRGVHARVAPDVEWIPQLDLATLHGMRRSAVAVPVAHVSRRRHQQRAESDRAPTTFIEAAKAVADQVPPDLLKQGLFYPLQANILETEIQTTARVAKLVFDSGLAPVEKPADMVRIVRGHVYKPEYHRPARPAPKAV